MIESSNNNLPTSFDVTPLLTKLNELENDQKDNVIQRVKLIELDPYYCTTPPSDQPTLHQQQQQQTRLFLAVAYGKHVVVAQLIALELGNIDDDDENGNEVSDKEQLEWIDVSDERILTCNNNNGDAEYDKDKDIGSGDPVVIFPPSYADSLPLYIGTQKSDDTDGEYVNFTADITSCALVPSPTVRIAAPSTSSSTSSSTTSEVITQRAVAVVLGTAHDQVLSLLLNVLDRQQIHTQSLGMERNVKFTLEYEECKLIENGEVTEEGNNTNELCAKYPCLYQILPFAKRFGQENEATITVHNNERKEEDDSYTANHNSNDHVQIYHPSLQATSSPNDTSNNNEMTYSGIESISFRRDNSRYANGLVGRNTMNQDYIWITYGNGTIVKFPSWRPFIAFHSNITTNGDPSDNAIDSTNNNTSNGLSVVPLDCPFRSPLDIPPQQMDNQNSLNESMSTVSAEEYWNIISSAVSSSQATSHQQSVKALVLAGQSAPTSVPPLAFNSSRVKYDPLSAAAAAQEAVINCSVQEGIQELPSQADHSMGSSLDVSSEGEQFGPVTGTVVEGTASIVKGALGMALGAVRWGLGTGGAFNEHHGHGGDDDNIDEFMDVDDTLSDIREDQQGTRDFDQAIKKGRGFHDLFPWPMNGASFPFSDSPRRFETAVVDPSGYFMATTDNLGRVIIFDLETNQPIRMFKGMRNVSCYFAELSCHDGQGKCTSISSRVYLVIHLRQRGAVEVYRLQQGARVAAVAVPPQKDCVVVECHGPPSEGCRVNSFLIERMDGLDESAPKDSHYVIDKLVIDDPNVVPHTNTSSSQVRPTLASENKMQLKILMQLLSPDTNIQCNAQTVLATFKSIKALSDLGEGLDALSSCSRLENEMGIDGSSLHSKAISYCKSRLESAKQIETQEGSGTVRKDVISELSLTLAYHDRLVNAYNVLHKYETRNGLSITRMEEQEVTDKNTLSPWALEALSWLSAASSNDTAKNRFMASSPNVMHNQEDDKPLKFYKFAMVCQSNGDCVYFTKVRRNRMPILRRCFRPLLQDLFVFKVVCSLFTNLGIEEDFEIQQKYFGEWISSLPTSDIAKSNLMSGSWRPMIRWLQDLILTAYETGQEKEKVDDDFVTQTVMLTSLMKYCMDMEDLPKAFLLAVICMDAVSSASMQLEQKTYGKVSQVESTRPWEELLRKLRVCLLVSLRLGGDVNPFGGINPLTVSSVSRPDIFSAYSWIARDELTLSHDNQVVMALEIACLSSSEAFYPSTLDGDTTQHKETMFESCRCPRQLTLNNPTGLGKNDTHSRTLLFYLKDHARFTAHLAANRALILASMWGKVPKNLHILDRCRHALQIALDRIEDFSLAVLVEIYQSQIRPVCRAMLFGFDEHELSEDIVRPLIEDPIWTRVFITLTKQILSMIIECSEKASTSKRCDYGSSSDGMWPPLRECSILSMLVKKLRIVQLSSVELHHMVLFAYEMTGNIGSLESFVPSFGQRGLFLIGSLYSEMPSMPKGSLEQKTLLDKSINDHAEQSSSPVVDSFSCIHDVELFGKCFGIGTQYCRTQFLLQMVRLGKDASINDLLGSSISSLDKDLFAEKTVQILCDRLHATILSLKQTRNYRSVLSVLDADASRWVREVATQSSGNPLKQNATTSLITTHSLIMRIQGISETLDDDLTDKINALCLMSGTLLKAVQTHEQESAMAV